MAEDAAKQRARELIQRLKEMEEQREDVATAARFRGEVAREGRIAGVQETEGRLGLVSPESRAGMRREVEGAGGFQRMIAEMTPSTAGAAIGAAGGAALGGGVGAIPGAMIGGGLGELFGQEAGITPESDVGLGIATGAPLAGPAVAGAARAAGRGTMQGLEAIPMVRTAKGAIAKQDAVKEIAKFAPDVYATQKGLMARPSDDLFSMVRNADPSKAWNKVTPEFFDKTRNSLGALDKELGAFTAFPEARQAQAAVRQMATTLNRLGSEISFDDIATMRSLLGQVVERAQGAGLKGGTANQAFKSFADDLDDMAEAVVPQRGMARITKAAFQRSKLEFAVQDIERAAAKFTKPVPGEEDAFEINISGMRKWLFDKTNPASKKYDKQLAEGLGEQTKQLDKALTALEKVAEKGKVGGPGSLVIQGAAAATGAGIGGFLGGPAGAMVGTLAGVSGPKGITAALASPRGTRILERAARVGRGRVNQGAWATAMEVMAQSVRSGTLQGREQLEEVER